MNINYLPAQTEYAYNHLYLQEYPFKSNMVMQVSNHGGSTTGKSNFPSMFDSVVSIYDQGVTDKNNKKYRKKS